MDRPRRPPPPPPRSLRPASLVLVLTLSLLPLSECGPLSKGSVGSAPSTSPPPTPPPTPRPECRVGNASYSVGAEVRGAARAACERCVCDADGSLACRRRACEPRPGCKALHRPDECCPTYQCDCEQDGRVYGNGEKLVDPADPCRVCYCQGGEVVCRRIACFVRSDCEPRLVPGRCCPEYDNCPLRGAANEPSAAATSPPSAEDSSANTTRKTYENPKKEITIKEVTPVSELPAPASGIRLKEILSPQNLPPPAGSTTSPPARATGGTTPAPATREVTSPRIEMTSSELAHREREPGPLPPSEDEDTAQELVNPAFPPLPDDLSQPTHDDSDTPYPHLPHDTSPADDAVPVVTAATPPAPTIVISSGSHLLTMTSLSTPATTITSTQPTGVNVMSENITSGLPASDVTSSSSPALTTILPSFNESVFNAKTAEEPILSSSPGLIVSTTFSAFTSDPRPTTITIPLTTTTGEDTSETTLKTISTSSSVRPITAFGAGNKLINDSLVIADATIDVIPTETTYFDPTTKSNAIKSLAPVSYHHILQNINSIVSSPNIKNPTLESMTTMFSQVEGNTVGSVSTLAEGSTTVDGPPTGSIALDGSSVRPPSVNGISTRPTTVDGFSTGPTPADGSSVRPTFVNGIIPGPTNSDFLTRPTTADGSSSRPTFVDKSPEPPVKEVLSTSLKASAIPEVINTTLAMTDEGKNSKEKGETAVSEVPVSNTKLENQRTVNDTKETWNSRLPQQTISTLATTPTEPAPSAVDTERADTTAWHVDLSPGAAGAGAGAERSGAIIASAEPASNVLSDLIKLVGDVASIGEREPTSVVAPAPDRAAEPNRAELLNEDEEPASDAPSGRAEPTTRRALIDREPVAPHSTASLSTGDDVELVGGVYVPTVSRRRGPTKLQSTAPPSTPASATGAAA